MKLEELQTLLRIFTNKVPTEVEIQIVSRLKTFTITRYPNEQGTYQMANFEVRFELE